MQNSSNIFRFKELSEEKTKINKWKGPSKSKRGEDAADTYPAVVPSIRFMYCFLPDACYIFKGYLEKVLLASSSPAVSGTLLGAAVDPLNRSVGSLPRALCKMLN